MLIIYLHLATVLPAFAIGTWLMLRRKGTPNHRTLGKIYLTLMGATAGISLFIPAHVGPRVLDHFGPIHVLTVITLIVVPLAYSAARKQNIRAHARAMIALYVGGLLIAGGFAFSPGRLLHSWVFGA